VDVSPGDPALRGHDPAVAFARHLDDVDVARFTSIYESSFPDEERESPDKLLGSVASGRGHLLLARDGNSRMLGFALMSDLGEGVSLLRYLVVDGALRDRGIGTRLVAAAREWLGATSRCGMLLEVEPIEHEDAGERRQRRRRVEFYERMGACYVECAPDYRMPSMTTGLPLPMKLMWIPGADAPPPTGEHLRSAVSSLCEHEYDLHRDHPLVAHNVNALVC
jgi:GNAT superfamily N-acetyltransferase